MRLGEDARHRRKVGSQRSLLLIYVVRAAGEQPSRITMGIVPAGRIHPPSGEGGMSHSYDATRRSPEQVLVSSAFPPPDSTPAQTSVAANRIALVGFGCSVLSLLLLVTIVMLEASEVLWPGFLLGIGFIAFLAGFVLSIIGLTKRNRIDRQNYKLAVADFVITVVVAVAIPFLVVLAFASFLNDYFT